MEDMDHIRRFSGGTLIARFSELVKCVADNSERVVIEHDGRVVALICIEDLDYLERADRIQDAEDVAELANLTPEDRESVPFDQVAAELAELDAAENGAHKRT
jgi:hypothetical protein